MKLKDNRVTKIDPNYKEIRKLDALLTEAGIPHTFQTFYWNKTGDLRGAQIIYPEDGPNRVADVIINGASYGNEFDLLEMMGLVPETAEPDELTGGNIEGYMTAERCFRRIRYHWDTHGGKEATGNTVPLNLFPEECALMMLDLLADGKELASEDIVKAAAEAGISERTVQNAKRNMGGILGARRVGGQWYNFIKKKQPPEPAS